MFRSVHNDYCKIRKLDISGFKYQYFKPGENPIGTTFNDIEVM